MKGGHEYGALPGHDALILMPGQGRDGGPEPADPRGPDEDHLERRAAVPQLGRARALEGLLLAAVGVALDGDIDESQRELRGTLDLARQQDQAGAGAEDRLARRVELLQRWHELPRVEQLEQGGALPAGHDEPLDLVELRGPAHLERRDADAVERRSMQREVPLQGQDPDHASTIRASGAGRTP